jgi:hypothetical protein
MTAQLDLTQRKRVGIVFVVNMKRYISHLHLHLLKTMLPHSSERSNTILTEIDEHVHTVGVHGLVHEDIVVVVVGENLLDGGSGAGLEFLDFFLGSAFFLEFVVDGFDVGCSTH